MTNKKGKCNSGFPWGMTNKKAISRLLLGMTNKRSKGNSGFPSGMTNKRSKYGT